MQLLQRLGDVHAAGRHSESVVEGADVGHITTTPSKLFDILNHRFESLS